MFDSNIPGTLITGSHDWGLVILSFLIVAFASYTALSLAVRVRETPQGAQKRFWTTGCAVSMGGGIWSMHFLAMLAFQLPIPVSYAIDLTVASLVIAVLAAGIAFHLSSKPPVSFLKISASGLVMGIGISAMHYTGMAAIELEGDMSYQPGLFGLSVVISVAVSTIALWIITRLSHEKNFFKGHLIKIISALVLGGAVCGMHYIGMAATVFSAHITPLSDTQITADDYLLATNIMILSLIILGASIAVSTSQRTTITNERQNFLNMLDNLPVCFHLQAPDYSIPFANKMFRERFEDPENKPCYTAMHQRSIPCEVCTTFKVFDSQENAYSVWKSLSQHTYLTVCTPFKDVDGSDLVMEMAIDITDQKNVEEELVLAKEEAERSSNAKSQFLSHMSHEFRTPLNAIIGFSQLLQLDPGSRSAKETKENALLIYQAGKHLLQLVNDILDLSAIESGKVPINLETFSPQGSLNELMGMFRPLAQNYQVKLINQVSDEDELFLYADKIRFKQALLNLISNGIKYNKPGGTVTLEMKALPGNQIRISILDTGRGIENDKLEQIFEAFHREMVHEFSIEGAGIGLTITRQLVELMNGKITVESTPGIGSCFSIDLPQYKLSQSFQTLDG
jgi:signal transduction histidine kinase/NO-binding membrane sensor protein with MHYT domain